MQYPAIGELLTHYLTTRGKFHVQWQSSSAEDVLRFCSIDCPGVLIISPRFPDMSAVELAKTIRNEFPTIRILLFAAVIHPELIHQMMAARIHGMVAAASPLADFLRAVEVVINGGCYFDAVTESILHSTRAANSYLTPRERTVLRLIAHGRSTKEIAADLTLSVKTIEKFREHLMSKLELHDVVRLTRYAIRHGIATLD